MTTSEKDPGRDEDQAAEDKKEKDKKEKDKKEEETPAFLGDPPKDPTRGGPSREEASRNVLADAVSLFFAGAASGWLIGLSVRSLSEGMITSLLGMVTTITAILAGLQPFKLDSGKGLRLNPHAVAALAVGLAAGASGGIAARTHQWLGADPPAAAPREAQPDASSGGPDGGAPSGTIGDSPTTEPAPEEQVSAETRDLIARMRLGVLYNAGDSAWCSRLQTATDDELETRAMSAVPQPQLSCLACSSNNLRDTARLRQLVDEACREVRDAGP